MPPEAALETFRSLPKRMRGRVARLLTDLESVQNAHKYPDSTAGAIVDRRVVMVPLEWTVSETMEAIKHAFELQGTAGTVFVVDADRTLVGIFRPRDLMVAAPDTPIRDIMLADFPVIHAHARQDDAAHIT